MVRRIVLQLGFALERLEALAGVDRLRRLHAGGRGLGQGAHTTQRGSSSRRASVGRGPPPPQPPAVGSQVDTVGGQARRQRGGEFARGDEQRGALRADQQVGQEHRVVGCVALPRRQVIQATSSRLDTRWWLAPWRAHGAAHACRRSLRVAAA